MDSFERVYPTEEELSKVNKNMSCPECPAVFNADTNLTLHLAKTHKKPHLLQPANANKIYHCPVTSCTYNKTSHFKQLRFLKQHYLKVHSEKNYICHLCQKGFSTEAFKNRHVEYCNVIFKCCDCDMFYDCYETLKTHSRRKKHSILDKTAYKKTTPGLNSSKEKVPAPSRKDRLILPKPSTSTGMIIISDTSEQASQTEHEDTQHSNQETQTLPTTKTPQLTVETQTSGNYIKKKPDNCNSTSKSIKTQTCTDPKNVSCNTSVSLEDFELHVHNVERSSSSTQTAIYNYSDYLYSASTSTHDSTHTDTSDLLTETLDTNFFNCNTETQTDLMFQDELFRYCDDSSNMCTQTCDDLLLGLNNMQTQTVFDDMLKSVESQTIMSQSKVPLSCKDMSHMETQTDMHFKKMLEEGRFFNETLFNTV